MKQSVLDSFRIRTEREDVRKGTDVWKGQARILTHLAGITDTGYTSSSCVKFSTLFNLHRPQFLHLYRQAYHSGIRIKGR